jgi:hypothetical protein
LPRTTEQETETPEKYTHYRLFNDVVLTEIVALLQIKVDYYYVRVDLPKPSEFRTTCTYGLLVKLSLGLIK